MAVRRKVLAIETVGFIGAFLAKRLLETTDDVIVGLDNMSGAKAIEKMNP